MKDRQDDDTFVIFYKEDFIRKSACESTSDDSMDMRKDLRGPQNRAKDGVHAEQKLVSKTGNDPRTSRTPRSSPPPLRDGR
jgi:hypothetical protein